MADNLRYYYREDTNQIIISSFADEDKYKVLPSPTSPDPIQKYGEMIIPYNSTSSNYNVRPGFNIPIRVDNALYLFYGNSKIGAGANSQTNVWKYNRYLHRPYRIFILTTTGSTNAQGYTKLKVEKAFVDYSASLPDPQIGTYIFPTPPNSDVVARVSAKISSYEFYNNHTTSSTTWPTASLKLYQGNPTVGMPGNVIASLTTSSLSLNEGADLIFTHSMALGTINPGDVLSLSLSVSSGSHASNIVGSGLVATNYSLAISAPGDTTTPAYPSSTYFDNYNQFSKYLDCHPDLNNVEDYNPNPNIFDLDYDNSLTGIIKPINLERVLDQTEVPSEVNDYIYSHTGLRNSRFDGSSVFSQNNNVHTNGDRNTYGKSPSIEVKRAFFAYYNAIHDLYPLYNNKTLFDIKYSIGPNGDVSSPVMDENSDLNLLNSLTGKDNNVLKIYSDTNQYKEFKNLNGFFPSDKIGYKPYPIFYSQTSSLGYSNKIELFGLKEMLGPQDYIDYSFRANGPDTSPTQTREIPEHIVSPDNFIGLNPISSPCYTASNGTTLIPITDVSGSEGPGLAKPLSDSYTYRFEHSITTTMINDIKYQNEYKKKQWIFWKKTVIESGTYEDVGYYELWVEGLGKNQQNSYSNFNNPGYNNDGLVGKIFYLKNIQVSMNVYYNNSSAPNGMDIKTFDVTSNFSRIEDKSSSDPSNPLIKGQSVVLVFNNDKIESILKSHGLSVNEFRKGGPLQYITWVITGEVDDSFVQGSRLNIKTRGHMEEMQPLAGQNPQNYFNPILGSASPIPASDIITLVGSKTEKSRAIEIGPTGSYWEYGLNANNEKMYNTLFFNVENGNLAWGKKFKQKDIKYTPTSSLNFQSGMEPNFIQFPQIVDSWETQTGDQIRFSNDEAQTYTIVSVEGPNSTSNPTNRLKITLDKDLDPNTNLNFFLIRRFKPEKGTIIMDAKYPYLNPPSPSNSTGFIFPQYLSDSISQDPDKIIKSLSSNGLIS